jgi:uncharacterized protein (DUF1800 family)
MEDSFLIRRFAQKVGFGFRPEEKIPSDPLTWIDDQLKEKRRFLGIASLEKSNVIEAWPEQYFLTIEERFNRAWQVKAREHELRRDKSISKESANRLKTDFENKMLTNQHDETRLYHRAIYAPDQIRQRLLHFWANHFFVSLDKVGTVMVSDHLERAIEDNLDGNFEELVYNASASPAMLQYLDNVENLGENSNNAAGAKKRNRVAGLNDNLAREILELHTVSPSMGYTENDIHQLAKVLSGWGLKITTPKPRYKSVKDWRHPFLSDNAQKGKIKIFDMTVGSQFGTSSDSLRPVITFLSEHPSTIENLSRKLCTHFIHDNPPDSSINRVKQVWIDTGGDLPSIHKQVLIEAFEKIETHAKFLWPLTWALQAARQTGASVIDGWNDISENHLRPVISSAKKISRELDQGFFLENRQPNGFSMLGSDWISPAHFERRFKFSLLVGRWGKPLVTPIDLIETSTHDENTLRLVSGLQRVEEQWMALLCSKHFMEA